MDVKSCIDQPPTRRRKQTHDSTARGGGEQRHIHSHTDTASAERLVHNMTHNVNAKRRRPNHSITNIQHPTQSHPLRMKVRCSLHGHVARELNCTTGITRFGAPSCCIPFPPTTTFASPPPFFIASQDDGRRGRLRWSRGRCCPQCREQAAPAYSRVGCWRSSPCSRSCHPGTKRGPPPAATKT